MKSSGEFASKGFSGGVVPESVSRAGVREPSDGVDGRASGGPVRMRLAIVGSDGYLPDRPGCRMACGIRIDRRAGGPHSQLQVLDQREIQVRGREFYVTEWLRIG